MSEFFLELFTEEMPPTLQTAAKEELLLIFKNFLDQQKIAYNKSNFSISEICYNVGFSSPSYFTKRFKEYTGFIPRQFKLKHFNENEIDENNHL